MNNRSRIVRSLKSCSAGTALLTLLVGSSVMAAPPLPPDLARAAADYDRAQIEGDRSQLERLLASDYQLVNGAGVVESREQFIAESADIKLDPFKVEHPIETVWNSGAVLAGEVHLSGTDHGKPFTAHFRFADVWRKDRGAWQVAFTEVTRFPSNGG